MIPCPHCDREFEKRSGLMRHVQATHPASSYADQVGQSVLSDALPVPVNPGGAIEPVVPVPEITPEDEAFVEAYRSVKTVAEPETYAESLDELEPGQEPYVDPPVDEKPSEPTGWLSPTGRVMGAWAGGSTATTTVSPPVRLTMADGAELEAIRQPTSGEQKAIRALIRSGRTESEAWQTVVGCEPPPRPPQPPDEMPVRLQQVRNRIYTSRTGQVDQIDARWLLQLAEIGAEAVALLPPGDIVNRWNGAIS